MRHGRQIRDKLLPILQAEVAADTLHALLVLTQGGLD